MGSQAMFYAVLAWCGVCLTLYGRDELDVEVFLHDFGRWARGMLFLAGGITLLFIATAGFLAEVS